MRKYAVVFNFEATITVIKLVSNVSKWNIEADLMDTIGIC